MEKIEFKCIKCDFVVKLCTTDIYNCSECGFKRLIQLREKKK